MDGLFSWLKSQKGGIDTYTAFISRALALRFDEPQHAAAARLLAALAVHFVEVYDGQPLSFEAADNAYKRLSYLVEKVAKVSASAPAERLAVLNEIGQMDLT